MMIIGAECGKGHGGQLYHVCKPPFISPIATNPISTTIFTSIRNSVSVVKRWSQRCVEERLKINKDFTAVPLSVADQSYICLSELNTSPAFQKICFKTFSLAIGEIKYCMSQKNDSCLSVFSWEPFCSHRGSVWSHVSRVTRLQYRSVVVYLNMVFTSFSQSVSHSQSVIQSGVGHLNTTSTFT